MNERSWLITRGFVFFTVNDILSVPKNSRSMVVNAAVTPLAPDE